jgi:hypothetical protein
MGEEKLIDGAPLVAVVGRVVQRGLRRVLPQSFCELGQVVVVVVLNGWRAPRMPGFRCGLRKVKIYHKFVAQPLKSIFVQVER